MLDPIQHRDSHLQASLLQLKACLLRNQLDRGREALSPAPCI